MVIKRVWYFLYTCMYILFKKVKTFNPYDRFSEEELKIVKSKHNRLQQLIQSSDKSQYLFFQKLHLTKL